MESRGQVNCYSKRIGRKSLTIYTINLANGTTPYMITEDGVTYLSEVYRLGGLWSLVVESAWYRPGDTEFHKLDTSTQDHILKGGLLRAPFKEALSRQLVDDPVMADWEHEQLQIWCLAYYGRRLP